MEEVKEGGREGGMKGRGKRERGREGGMEEEEQFVYSYKSLIHKVLNCYCKLCKTTIFKRYTIEHYTHVLQAH